MTDRRPARDQRLPESHVEPLSRLRNTDLYIYCRDLYHIGWTLRAIGEACTPPRSRSTIRSWIMKLGTDPVPYVYTSNVLAPVMKTTVEYVPKRAPSPGISPSERVEISDLAPVARRYRSGMSPSHRAARANNDLTRIAQRLNEKGVPVQELADAAGVTYRAMARRIKDGA